MLGSAHSAAQHSGGSSSQQGSDVTRSSKVPSSSMTLAVPAGHHAGQPCKHKAVGIKTPTVTYCCDSTGYLGSMHRMLQVQKSQAALSARVLSSHLCLAHLPVHDIARVGQQGTAGSEGITTQREYSRQQAGTQHKTY